MIHVPWEEDWSAHLEDDVAGGISGMTLGEASSCIGAERGLPSFEHGDPKDGQTVSSRSHRSSLCRHFR